jgi:hypothetical protein
LKRARKMQGGREERSLGGREGGRKGRERKEGRKEGSEGRKEGRKPLNADRHH